MMVGRKSFVALTAAVCGLCAQEGSAQQFLRAGQASGDAKQVAGLGTTNGDQHPTQGLRDDYPDRMMVPGKDGYWDKWVHPNRS
jgi:hypothetical protein